MSSETFVVTYSATASNGQSISLTNTFKFYCETAIHVTPTGADTLTIAAYVIGST